MTTTQENGTLIARPGRNIVASQLEAMRSELKGLIQEGCTRLVLDLEGVDMIDSKGLALFVQCHQALKERGGSLVVVTKNADFRFLFHAMRLDQHFSVVESL